MVKIDNMGGVISVEFILQKEIHYFAAFGNNCTVSLQNYTLWKPIDTKMEGVTLNVKADREDAGLIYTISGSILIKKTDPYLSVLSLNPYILLKYKNTDNVVKIAGTDEYPLVTTLEPLTPTRATGFLGYQLNFEGKQLIEPPFLNL